MHNISGMLFHKADVELLVRRIVSITLSIVGQFQGSKAF